jgi:hypothetical protein
MCCSQATLLIHISALSHKVLCDNCPLFASVTLCPLPVACPLPTPYSPFTPPRCGLFLHSPFPSSEIFRTFPKREELLRSMLNADLIGEGQGGGDVCVF